MPRTDRLTRSCGCRRPVVADGIDDGVDRIDHHRRVVDHHVVSAVGGDALGALDQQRHPRRGILVELAQERPEFDPDPF